MAFLLYMCVCMHAKPLRSCLTLCDPMDHSLPSSSDQGILEQNPMNTGVGGHFLLQGFFCTELLKYQIDKIQE